MRRKMGRFAGLPVMVLGAVLCFAGQANADARIDLGTGGGAPGTSFPLDVFLVGSTGESIAGTQNDITFTEGARISGRYDEDAGDVVANCLVNPNIRKRESQFAFLPAGCATGTGPDDVNTDACTGVRALVLSLSNTDAIPGTDTEPGTRIYTCDIDIADNAVGTLSLACSGAGASDPDGAAIDASCTNGTVVVVDATATPTATVPPPTSTPTNTSAVTNTPVNTATPTGGGDEDDDGCQAVAPVSSHTGWLLFAPAALLLWSRRRSR